MKYDKRWGLSRNAIELAMSLDGTDTLWLACVLETLAENASDLEEIARDAPLRGETRASLDEVSRLADKLAKLLETGTLARLGGIYGFEAAARSPGGEPHIQPATPGSLRTLAVGARVLHGRITGGGGAARITDSLGNPRGRMICAAGAVLLIERQTGRRPSKVNPEALSFARSIWRLSGGEDSARSESGEGEALTAWERHLSEARNPPDDRIAAALSARRYVKNAFEHADRMNAIWAKFTQ